MVRETGRSGYKVKLKAKLRERFPGIEIRDQDPNYFHQGIPDLELLYNGRWAMLEVKAAHNSKRQPNQKEWIEYYNNLGFAAFIHPENEEEVLDALSRSFTSCG
jgi:hypothetical protein